MALAAHLESLFPQGGTNQATVPWILACFFPLGLSDSWPAQTDACLTRSAVLHNVVTISAQLLFLLAICLL